MSTNASISYKYFFSLLAALTLLFFYPLITAFLLVIFLFSRFENKNYSLWFTGVGLIILFSLLNIQKGIDGDWVWYTSHYKLLNEIPFLDYLGSSLERYAIKSTEPVYYFISFVTSRATDANVNSLSVVVTMLVYIPMMYALSLILKKTDLSNIQSIIVLLVCMLVGITFVLTTHLVRQEIAASLYFTSLVLLFEGKKKSGGFLLLVSLLTHNSLLFVFIITALVYIIEKLNLKKISRFFLYPIICFILGWIYVSFFAGSGYEIDSDGDLTLLSNLMDILTIVLLIYLIKFESNSYRAQYIDSIFLFLLGYVFFLVAISALPIPLLRMHFYMDSIRFFILAFFCINTFKSSIGLILMPLFLLLSLIYFYLKISMSVFIYDVDLSSLFLNTNIFNVM